MTRSRRIICGAVTAPTDTWRHEYHTGNRNHDPLDVDWLRDAHRRDDDGRGQGMVEYALVLVRIAIVVIVILPVVGGAYLARHYTTMLKGN